MRLEAFKSPKRIWLKSPENDENIRQLQGICLQLIALPALICCGEEMTLLLGKATGRKGEFLTPVYLAFISSSIKRRQLLLWLFLSTGREVNGENGVMYHFLLRWGGRRFLVGCFRTLPGRGICHALSRSVHFLGPDRVPFASCCCFLLLLQEKRCVIVGERKKKKVHSPADTFLFCFVSSIRLSSQSHGFKNLLLTLLIISWFNSVVIETLKTPSFHLTINNGFNPPKLKLIADDVIKLKSPFNRQCSTMNFWLVGNFDWNSRFDLISRKIINSNPCPLRRILLFQTPPFL